MKGRRPSESLAIPSLLTGLAAVQTDDHHDSLIWARRIGRSFVVQNKHKWQEGPLSERRPKFIITVENTRAISQTVLYIILFLAIPFVLAAINPIWLKNRAGDMDVWMYYGYFYHLYQFTDDFIWPMNAYIGTRIPYILPGYIVYHITGDSLYHYVFNISMIYTTIALSFFYVLRKHLSLDVAAATTALILTNFYFLRSVGWDYVDKCVVAYEALTFAMLALAPHARRPWLAMVGAGFFAASMLFVHIASAILFPVFLAYSGYVAHRLLTPREWARHTLRLALFGTIGAVLAQMLWGGLTVALHGGNFFFIMKQINFVAPNMGGWNYPLDFLIEQGYWIIYHLAVFFASVAAIVLLWTRIIRVELNRFEWFALWTATLLNGFLLVAEITKFMWLLSRDGMHSTIFIPLSMMAYGVLLFRKASPGLVLLVVLTGIATVLILLGIGQGTGLQAYLKINMPTLAALQAAALVAAIASGRTIATAAAIIVIGALNAFASSNFQDDIITRRAHVRVVHDIGDRLPKIFYSKTASYASVYSAWSLIATFTDRAIFPSEAEYPLILKELNQGDAIVVATSTEYDPNAARANILKKVKGVELVDSFKAGDIWLHIFNVTQK